MRVGCALSVLKTDALASWNLKPAFLTVSFLSSVGGYIWVGLFWQAARER